MAVEPVGQKEIAERLGVRQNTVAMWLARRTSTEFPAPKWTVGGRPAWEWAEVRKWALATGRLSE